MKSEAVDGRTWRCGSEPWPLWPGSGVLSRGATLKALGSSLWQVFTPRPPVCHRYGCEKPKDESKSQMTLINAMPSPALPAPRSAPQRLSRSPALRAARGKTSSPTESARALRTDPNAKVYDPAEIDVLYSMPADGALMALGIQRGDRLAMSKLEEPRAGDLVAVWFRPELTPPGDGQVLLMRLLEPLLVRLPYAAILPLIVQPVIAVASPHSGETCGVPARHLLAVHRCIGRIGGDDGVVRWEGGAS